MDKQKIYFPNLNGLRFIAAFLVIIHHLEQMKEASGINNYFNTVPFIGIIGKLGVVLFFVLSGFLITYLLLEEEHLYTKIDIKQFYIRRILRIWPLYFLIITLALLVLPNIHIFDIPGFGKELIYKHLALKIILFAMLSPNIVGNFLGIIPYASQTWSIGIEEQFYLVWPLALKLFKRHRVALMLCIIISCILISNFLSLDLSSFLLYKKFIKAFWSTFNIDCMAIGGLFAILLFKKSKFLKIFMNNYLFYATIISVSILMIKGIRIPFIILESYAFLFGIIILNFAANDKIDITLENKLLNYLGKISYGIYMYHPIAIGLSLYIAITINCTTNWLLYPLTLLSTIVLAGISHKYFESIFLKLKIRFSNIISGERPKKLF